MLTQLCVVFCGFCSVAQSYPTLYDPMDCRMPGFPVLHYLLEFNETHVHSIGDTIQPSHSLLPLSPPAFNLTQHQGFFHWLVLRIRWPKYWSFNSSISPSKEYSGLTDLISFLSKGLSKTLSRTTVWKHQFISTQPSLWSNSHPYTTTGKTIALTDFCHQTLVFKYNELANQNCMKNWSIEDLKNY